MFLGLFGFFLFPFIGRESGGFKQKSKKKWSRRVGRGALLASRRCMRSALRVAGRWALGVICPLEDEDDDNMGDNVFWCVGVLVVVTLCVGVGAQLELTLGLGSGLGFRVPPCHLVRLPDDKVVHISHYC